METPIRYVGLDVHKDTIAIALAEAGQRGEVREHGKIANTPAALKLLAARLARNGHELRFCYEAGPCGYGIQRQLSAAGHGCVVVAPSLIPRKPGDRIKTDRRDAINLAKLHRAGELTAVWVPDQAHEAIRDLVRARLAAVRTLRQARQRLAGFLLRQAALCDFPLRDIDNQSVEAHELLADPVRQKFGLRMPHGAICIDVGLIEKLALALEGGIDSRDIFVIEGEDGKGKLEATGSLPTFMDKLLEMGLIRLESMYR